MNFGSIQELWDYCSFCPLCQRECRTIEVWVGLEDFEIITYLKKGRKLSLRCNYWDGYWDEKRHVFYDIDCLENSCEISFPTSVVLSSAYLEKIIHSFFYFYLNAFCKECNRTTVATSDIEVDPISKKFSGISLEREEIVLCPGSIEYHLTMNYMVNHMMVKTIDHDVIEHVESTVRNKTLYTTLPLIKFDFSDPIRAMERLKTFLLFS